MPSHSFSLYVTGQTGVSRVAIRNARRLCDSVGNSELTIIDILAEPDRAERHRVIATPLLVKESSPIVFLLGDLSNTQSVASALGVSPDSGRDESPVFPVSAFAKSPEKDET